MRSNLGPMGRGIAVIISVLLFIFFVFFLNSRWAIISAIPLFVAITGFCPCKKIASNYKMRKN